MTIPQDVMVDLATIGLTPEQARAVASMLARVEQATASESEEGKEKARARWRKWKESQQTNVSKRLQTTANVSKRLVSGDARVEDKTSNLDIEPQKEERKQDAPARDVSDFKAELAELDTDRLTALIKHRRSKRGQITGLSARLFREAAENCGLSLSQAVDTCIDRNWITLKPEWLNKPQARGSPPQKEPNLSELFAFKDRMGRNDADYQGPQSEPAIRYLPSAGRG
jgi:hypothetical protein